VAEIQGAWEKRFGAVRDALAESLDDQDVDPGARMTVAYAMNQMLDRGLGDHRGLGIVIAAYEGLE
jgi:hypothetical protein